MYVFPQEDCSIEERHYNWSYASGNQLLVLGVLIFSSRCENSNSVMLGQTNYRDKAGTRLLMHVYIKLAFCLALLTDKLSQPSQLRRNLPLVW